MDLIVDNTNKIKLPFLVLLFGSVFLVIINENKIKKVVSMFSSKIVVFNFTLYRSVFIV